MLPGEGEEAEDGIGATGNGNGYGKYVVHDEGAARYHTHRWGEKLAGNQIGTSPGGKGFDDLYVTGTDDKDGQRCKEGQDDGKAPVTTNLRGT